MGRGHETESPPRGDGALGMNLSRCNYTSKVAHLRIYRQTHAETSPLRVAGCNVPATRSLQTPRRSPSRRSPGGHSRGTAPSAHGLITPENTRRHDTGRLLGDDGHERRDLLGLERGVLHLLAVAVRRGVLRGREKWGGEKVSDSMRGSSPGPSAPDAVGSVETRRGSRLRDMGERSRGERREIRRFPVIPRAFPSHASGFRV